MSLIKEFFNYYIIPIRHLLKHPLYFIASFMVYAMFFYVSTVFLMEFVDHWLVNRVFYQLVGDSIYFIPEPVLKIGTSVSHPFLVPLVLFMAWSISISFSSIITGLFNTRLSRSQEATMGNIPPREHHSSLFEILEDVTLLAFNIIFSFFLIFLYSYFDFNSSLNSAIFWLVTPYIYGLYNIGYALLPRKITYLQMLYHAFTSFRSFVRFSVFSIASGLVPSILSYIAANISWNYASFIFLLVLFCLQRPIGVVSGTCFGLEVFESRRPAKTSLSCIYFMKFFATVFVAAFILATTISFFSKLDSKLNLFSCKYHHLKIETPLLDMFKKNDFLSGLSKVLLQKKSQVVSVSLDITNPTRTDVIIEKFDLFFMIGDEKIAQTSISGVDLRPDKTFPLSLEITISSTSIVQAVKKIISDGFDSISIKGHLFIRTPLIDVPWPVTLVTLEH